MDEIVLGYQRTQVLYVAAKLSLAEHLDAGPMDAGTLAASVGAEAEALYRLLRALEFLGFVEEPAPGTFELTASGRLLRADAPGGLRDEILMNVEMFWDDWGRLEHTIRTGLPSTPEVRGAPFFEWLHGDADRVRLFNHAMRNLVGTMARAVADAYDFRLARRIVDIGGGSGQLLSVILESAPEARGVVFDLPATVEEARAFLGARGLSARCECVGGDFFQSVPGGDLLLLSGVIGDWNDEESVRIFSNCRRAIEPQGRLLLLERVLIPEEPPPPAAFLDLHMLVLLGGKGRTATEFASLLSRAGFRLTRVVPTGSPRSIVEAAPA